MSIANTFLFHLLLQPISIYCNGVVTQQFQGLDEGRSRQLHEGLHDTCGFLVSIATQVIHCWPGRSSKIPQGRAIGGGLSYTNTTCMLNIDDAVAYVRERSLWPQVPTELRVNGSQVIQSDLLKCFREKKCCALWWCFFDLTGQRQCNNAQLPFVFLGEKWTLAEKDCSASSSTCWFEKNMRPQLKAGGSLANLGFLGWEGKAS